jgi:hypothetical protein
MAVSRNRKNRKKLPLKDSSGKEIKSKIHKHVARSEYKVYQRLKKMMVEFNELSREDLLKKREEKMSSTDRNALNNVIYTKAYEDLVSRDEKFWANINIPEYTKTMNLTIEERKALMDAKYAFENPEQVAVHPPGRIEI